VRSLRPGQHARAGDALVLLHDDVDRGPKDLAMAAESSVEPSSTTMTRSGTSWASALSIAPRITAAPLYAGV